MEALKAWLQAPITVSMSFFVTLLIFACFGAWDVMFGRR
jgi:hypothetical protein